MTLCGLTIQLIKLSLKDRCPHLRRARVIEILTHDRATIAPLWALLVSHTRRYSFISNIMTNSSSAFSLDFDSLIPDLFDDRLEVVGYLQNAVSIMMSEHLGQNGNKYRGKSVGARKLNRGTFTWFDDYLSETLVYSAAKFRKMFHIPLKIYWRLHAELLDEDSSFSQQSYPAR